MKPNSRHAKPSMKVLAPRMDRKLNILVKHVPTLLDHCQRLLREKEILQGENETLKKTARGQLREADKFMNEPLRFPFPPDCLRVVDISPNSISVKSFPTHDYGTNEPRCVHCGFLRAAIEASGLACVA